MTNYDVIKKLLGPIEPVGESNFDEKRYENLEATIEVVDKLLCDLNEVAGEDDRLEHSIAKIGKRASQFIKDIRGA